MKDLTKLRLPPEVAEILSCYPGYTIAGSANELADLK